MKRKIILTTLLLLSILPCLRGQRKEMSQARSYLKSGKDFDKAEKLMEDLLSKDSLNRMNPKIYLILYQAVSKQYEAGNEKLYLKEKYDTSLLFNLTKKMFAILEALDSVDMATNGFKGKKLDYRDKHAAELNSYRPNLYFGGAYYIRKKDFKTAFSFFDAYLNCGKQPLFDKYKYWETDSRMSDAAFWATYCGFKLNSPDSTLMYADIALKDTTTHRAALVYVSNAYNILGAKDKYRQLLKTGFAKYKDSPYFFSHLMDCYTTDNELDSALYIVNKALQTDGDNTLFLFAKSTVLLNKGCYDECITVGDTLINLNDTLPDAYYNVGTAYINKGLALIRKEKSRQGRAGLKALYRKALPYMERYRKLAPQAKNKWGPALYRIYLMLNMGKEFDEIDALLNEEN